METRSNGPRLIIVCGLPGSGKTTLARQLESRLGAVRFSPDEWIDALSLNLYDEEQRGKIEALQWKIGQELLARGLIVIIEWGTWEDPSEIACGSEPERWAPPLNCITCPPRRMCSLRGLSAEAWRAHLSNEMPCADG